MCICTPPSASQLYGETWMIRMRGRGVGEGKPCVGRKSFLTVRNERCVVSVDRLVFVRRLKCDLARDSRQHDHHTYTTERKAIGLGDSH